MNEQETQEQGEPQVIYIERDKPKKRLKDSVQKAAAQWRENSVDAPLPEQLSGRVPASWDSPRGRALIGVVCLVMLALWVLVMVLVLS